MSKPKRLPPITDAQRAATRAQDHLHYLVYTIDFEMIGESNNGGTKEALRMFRQELDDEFDDEFKTLYIQVAEIIIANLQRMRE